MKQIKYVPNGCVARGEECRLRGYCCQWCCKHVTHQAHVRLDAPDATPERGACPPNWHALCEHVRTCNGSVARRTTLALVAALEAADREHRVQLTLCEESNRERRELQVVAQAERDAAIRQRDEARAELAGIKSDAEDMGFVPVMWAGRAKAAERERDEADAALVRYGHLRALNGGSGFSYYTCQECGRYGPHAEIDTDYGDVPHLPKCVVGLASARQASRAKENATG